MDALLVSAKGFAVAVLGLEGTSLLVLLIFVSMICQVVARLIPEDATGWRNVVRVIASIVGLHVANRITGGVTVSDIANEFIKRRDGKKPQTEPEIAEAVDDRIVEAVEHEETADEPLELVDRIIIPAFPGRLRSEGDEEIDSGAVADDGPDELRDGAGGDREGSDRASEDRE